ncbi:uncharacterized protein [Lepeophtheirus salmonis]|uniref:uncharacterized protein n=1 Tax=Lepeophtheirus salmonis TaxID=72036 RepID=UPI001AEA1AAD|nr:tissue factor pathway inhibitor-like [Lepeophtheirus salmonis]
MWRSAERPIKVCRLEKNIGYCHDQIDKYFFNTHTRKCEKFIYSGCGGNKNNFDNETECNETCTQKGSPLIKDKHGLINEPGHGLISVPEKGLNSGTEHVLISGPEHGLTSGAEHGLISGPEHGLTSGPGHGLNKGTGHGLNKGQG